MSEQIIVEPTADADVLSEAHARSLVDQINQTTGRLVETMADIQILVTTAYHGRAWVALGYESWEALGAAEFTQAKMWASVEERKEHTRAFVEAGLSFRAIAVVMGVGVATVHRDAASQDKPAVVGVPNGTPTTAVTTGDDRSGADVTGTRDHVRPGLQTGAVGNQPSRPSGAAPRESLGLDGKRYARATATEKVDRALQVAQRSAQGRTQAQIGEEFGVTQKTISNDLRALQQWTSDLDEQDRVRLESGEMERDEFASKAGLDLVSAQSPRLRASAESGARTLSEATKFLHTQVIAADAWIQECDVLSPGLAKAASATVLETAHWLAREIEWDAIDVETCHRHLAEVQDAARHLELTIKELTKRVTQ